MNSLSASSKKAWRIPRMRRQPITKWPRLVCQAFTPPVWIEFWWCAHVNVEQLHIWVIFFCICLLATNTRESEPIYQHVVCHVRRSCERRLWKRAKCFVFFQFEFSVPTAVCSWWIRNPHQIILWGNWNETLTMLMCRNIELTKWSRLIFVSEVFNVMFIQKCSVGAATVLRCRLLWCVTRGSFER